MVDKWVDSLLKNKGRYHTIMGKLQDHFRRDISVLIQRKTLPTTLHW